MAGQPDQRLPEQPWSRAEKNYLLAEIIKTSNVNPTNLFMFVVQSGIEPAWEDTPLPPGRSLNSCRSTFRQFQQPSLPQSFDPRTPGTTAGHPSLKRSYEGPSFMGSREIRPKPSSGDPYSPALAMDQPPKKKRGRPTKEEAKAKAEAQIVSGGPAPRPEAVTPSSAPPAVRPAVRPPAEVESPMIAAPPELPPAPRPILPPAARVPISSMITQTPPTAVPEAGQSSSSSGKRKRGRSTRSDPENYPLTRESSMIQGQEYESPYREAALESSDTPARAARLRHRDDTEAGAQRFDPQTQSAQSRPEPRTDPETK